MSESRWYRMGEWALFRVILPFAIPVLGGWVLVKTISDGLVQTPSSPDVPFPPPDWSVFWQSPKILLVGLLVSAGCLHDLWFLRGKARSKWLHVSALLGTVIIGGYGALTFSALMFREVFQFGPASNILVDPLVITIVLLILSGGVRWLRVTFEEAVRKQTTPEPDSP